MRDGADDGAPAVQSLHRVLDGCGSRDRGDSGTEGRRKVSGGEQRGRKGNNSKGKPELSAGVSFAALISPCFDPSKAFPSCFGQGFFFG